MPSLPQPLELLPPRELLLFELVELLGPLLGVIVLEELELPLSPLTHGAGEQQSSWSSLPPVGRSRAKGAGVAASILLNLGGAVSSYPSDRP